MPSSPPPPPAVQTLALRYAKRGPLRFASHRVIQRAFERAVRRAALPIAHSAGFTPHPRLSYLGAAPTGAASEAEYLLIRLTEELAPDAVLTRLNRAMPRDLPILEVRPWDKSAQGDLAALLSASVWLIEFGQLPVEILAPMAARFLALESYEAEQVRPGPPGQSDRSRGRRGARPARLIDVRSNVLAMSASATADPRPRESASGGWGTRVCVRRQPVFQAPLESSGDVGPGDRAGTRDQSGDGPEEPGSTSSAEPCAILEVVLRHATPAVRPDDVIAALVANGLEIGSPPRATRLAQGEYSVEAGVIQAPFSRIGT
ncbi:MAG: TIGR03936 family radical SAM-associated protein [Bifidobacteriaceae bacterium]|jgi:radical SAM-linked protein|nr:TIGR03936 family radical SAM-associated protein [Bifidobacteriaceae bacterium]